MSLDDIDGIRSNPLNCGNTNTGCPANRNAGGICPSNCNRPQVNCYTLDNCPVLCEGIR